MKRFFPILIILLLLPVPSLAQEKFVPQNAGLVEARVSFNGNIQLSDTADSLEFSIYALPADAVSYDVSTDYEVVTDDQGNKLLKLKWKDVASTPYSIDTKVVNTAQFQGAKKVPFPYNPPRDKLQYLNPTENSPIPPEIKREAERVVRGADSGFEAVTALSTWVHNNIEYDSQYASKIHPATFAYNKRAGVCAEFTNLFVSMARSQGIPARSVAGVIYAPDGSWGYHAWAEVYLDGWVPVDPTWNEIGWLDASHIEVGKFKDGGDVTMKAEYRATGRRQISFTQPSVNVDMSRTRQLSDKFDTTSETYPNKIGIGDSAVVEVNTRSRAEGCLATSTKVVPRVDSTGRPVVEVTEPKAIAVCPDEKATSHFILDTRDDLDDRYVYSNLADIKTFLGENIVADLTVNPSEEEQSSLDLVVERSRTKKGDRVGFEVRTDADDYRLFSDMSLGEGHVTAGKTGDHYIIAATSSGEVEREKIEVVEDLKFRISGVTKPSSVTCGQDVDLTFQVENLEEARTLSVNPRVSSELSSVPESTIDLGEGETRTVNITTSLKEQCSGKDQFISIGVDDQRVHESIDVEKQSTLGDGTGDVISSFLGKIGFAIKELFSSLTSLLG